MNSSKPNVVIVITDDQGYGDLGCHGNPVARTPHLDKLYEQSIRLTDFHAAPMCTPTRGQLLTGLDAARNGAVNVSSGRTLLRAGFTHVLLAENVTDRGIQYDRTLARLAEAQWSTPAADSLITLADYRFPDADGGVRRYRLVMLR